MGKLKKLRNTTVYLGTENFNGKPELGLTFTNEPELIDTDYGQKYIVGVDVNGSAMTWQMNATSSDYLDSQITGDWKGKKAVITVVDQLIDGKMRKVIYAKGSVA